MVNNPLNKESKEVGEVQIYLLPNLMTSGNLFCGFYAIFTIYQALLTPNNEYALFNKAILLIFGACIFDMLDGRLARLGGKESKFGREFDSIADVVSFGMAPSLLVYHVVLRDFPDKLGLWIAFFYLLCGSLRLARFNCLSPSPGDKNYGKKSMSFFCGFPIPAAAGTIVSITHTLLWFYEGERSLGLWGYFLPFLMILVSVAMMMSVKYPSFKNITWSTKRSAITLLVVILCTLMLVFKHQWVPTVMFLMYFIYGFLRPFIPKKLKSNIED